MCGASLPLPAYAFETTTEGVSRGQMHIELTAREQGRLKCRLVALLSQPWSQHLAQRDTPEQALHVLEGRVRLKARRTLRRLNLGQWLMSTLRRHD